MFILSVSDIQQRTIRSVHRSLKQFKTEVSLSNICYDLVWTNFLANNGKFEEKTRRERPKSAPYLRLKNIQGTTIGKIWKLFFFRKSHNAENFKKAI